MSAAIADLAKALTKAVGKNDSEDEITNYLDSGYPPLNKIISDDYDKGIPYGRMGEVYGPSAVGKTVIATSLMIAAQRAGGVACFIDWERAFSTPFAREVGLDDNPGRFVYKRSKTWEEGNSVAMMVGEAIRKNDLIAPEAPIVCVMDSIAAAVPQSVIDTVDKKGMAGLSMNDTTALARVASSTLKIINQFGAEFNMIMVYLNQIRVKPGVIYGDPTTTPGGQSMEFYATWRLALGAKKIMVKEGDDKEFAGRLITATTKKNKLARPFQEMELRLEYAPDGRAFFNVTLGMIEYLEGLNILKKGSKAGEVVWTDGVSYARKALAAKIDTEAKQAELNALLPR